jgi:hypothetical protein
MAIVSLGTDAPAAPRRIVGLNIRGGGGTRAERLCAYLDAHDPDTVILTEWPLVLLVPARPPVFG